MNIIQTIDQLLAYGTPTGAEHAWDTRGRGKNLYQKSPEEEVAQDGKGKREIRSGIQVYFTTGADLSKVGQNAIAIIGGRNALTYHDTSSGTKYSYKGQSYRGHSIDEAVDWAIGQHIKQQEFRQQQRDKSAGKSSYRPVWSAIDKAVNSAIRAMEKAKAHIPHSGPVKVLHKSTKIPSKHRQVIALSDSDLGMGMKTPAAIMRFKKVKIR